MEPNTGWLFYQDFHNNLLRDTANTLADNNEPIKDINWEFLKTGVKQDRKKQLQEKNAALLKVKVDRMTNLRFSPFKIMLPDGQTVQPLNLQEQGAVKGEQTFTLTTSYPGLVVGSGYAHESHAEGEFKLGFFFDYSSGQPVIPGSSVKGLLRSAFKQPVYIAYKLFELGSALIKVDTGNVNDRRGKEYRKSLMEQLSLPDNIQAVENLTLEIFEGTLVNGSVLDIYRRDIFHDAFITASHKHEGRFLGSDYITPHKHVSDSKLSAFADPTPIHFLKVLPEVTFCFQFDVKDNGSCSIEMKIKLFNALLKDLGIGAKTNVGYGQFKRETDQDSKALVEQVHTASATQTLENYMAPPKTGDKLNAKIVSVVQKKVMILLNGKERIFPINRCPASLHKDGDIIPVKFGTVTKKGEVLDINYP